MQHYTHKLSQISETILGAEVQIAGWLHNKRDHGGVLFLDIRAFGEKVQVVVEKQEMIDSSSKIKVESVIKINGIVRSRPEGTINEDLKSGKVEVVASGITIESPSQQIPFQININEDVSEDLRLEYRFLDLRTKKMQKNILLRSQVISYIRKIMEGNGFVEFQTPILTASSPEGARDFLVPSRLNPGKFYALPQAPQQFKQLLMVSGFEKYFQIAPCFRDEDARADRSPGEFYQLDVEMSFATQEDIFSAIEPVMHNVFTKFSNKKVSSFPFKRIPYNESMLKYGSDKPDLRNPIEIFDASEIFSSSKFKVFAEAITRGEVVRAIPVPKHGKSTEYFKTEMQNFAKQNGAEFGIAYMIFEDGTVKNCPIRNAYKIDRKKEEIHEEEFNTLVENIKTSGNLQDGDAIFFACGKESVAAKLAGLVRTKVGSDLNLIAQDCFEFCWIVDFPFYEESSTEKNADGTPKIEFSHNPFSMPQGGMDSLLLSQKEFFEQLIDVNADDTSTSKFSLNSGVLNVLSEKYQHSIYDVFVEICYTPDSINIKEPHKLTVKSDQNRSIRRGLIDSLYSKCGIDPLSIKAYQYDIVCNGIELSSGAIRNHKLDVMFKAFKIAGYSEEEVRKQFAGMVEAFSYGAPPHGGIAPGIDRMVMLLAEEDTIRDIIAFPLNGKGQDLLMKAPATVEEKQLRELGIQLRKKNLD
ncbi:MAG: aspartyl-tRNA synthetase [Candidatus Deianiraeaceae bacterium]|jgi:aspartyl-tRNA synthetase